MKKRSRSNTLLKVLLMVFTLSCSVLIFHGANFNVLANENRPDQPLPSEDSAYRSYEYVLDGYDINITVHDNNTFDIVEQINAYFNIPKHGIIRTIPLRNKVERLDGTTSNNRVKITKINVNTKYTTSVKNKEKVIKIGDAGKYLLYDQNYRLSYNYNIGKDPMKDYDEFYFNLIGKDWDTVIGGVNFTITLPKAFDEKKLGFSRGPKGSTDNSGIHYKVEGNVISGYYDGILNPGEALTVRLQLPEGYFVNAGIIFDWYLILSFALPMMFVAISVLLWLIFGKDDKVIETVEFYPPEGFNSAEIGFLYRGRAEDNDVISLLIYLANQGYLKISEMEDKALFTKSKSFKLTKLKDYDGNNENERIFLNDLFRTTKKPATPDIISILKSIKNNKKAMNVVLDENYDTRNEVTSDDLTNSFYTTLNKIKTSLNRKENRYEIFEKNSLGKGFIAFLMIVGIYLLITVKPVMENGSIEMLPFAIIFPGIGFTVLFAMVFGKTKLPVKIFGLVWGLGFGGMPWATMVLPSLLAEPLYLLAYISGMVCVFIIVMIFKIMPKRTTYGNEILGRIHGFKTFLETSEKMKLEALVLEDPNYFYNILPFTYVLGVSDTWIKKFEVIALTPPDWYDSGTPFSASSFGNFMDSTMSTARSAMSSSPSSSGGGGSSGGGSSGGGSGGGGGSSW